MKCVNENDNYNKMSQSIQYYLISIIPATMKNGLIQNISYSAENTQQHMETFMLKIINENVINVQNTHQFPSI